MRILAPLFALSILFASCHFGGHRISGNGNIKKENRTVPSFDAIDVSGNFQVFVRQDSVRSVSIEADDNLMEYIDVHVDGSTLVIEPKNHTNLKGSRDLKLYISSTRLSDLEASGACVITSENQISDTNRIKIRLTGASDVNMDVKTPSVETDLRGAGSIRLRGQTRDFSVDGSGSVSVKCMDLLAENVDVDISGAGNAAVYASVKLNVSVSGAGDVRYKGNATVTRHISGAGSVQKMD